MKKLENHFDSLLESHKEFSIYLDCEGRDLGRVGGKLGLVQLGLEKEIYLVDVIKYSESLNLLKTILEHPKVEKVVWDGRSDYTELRLGHGINLAPALDIQLVHVYKTRYVGSYRKYNILEGMAKAFSSAGYAVQKDLGVNVRRLQIGLDPL